MEYDLKVVPGGAPLIYIGVYVVASTINHIVNDNVCKYSIQELVKINLTGVNVFLFCSKDVNYKKKKIQGLYYDELRGEWRKQEFNYPHVLYSRKRGIESRHGKFMREIMLDHGVEMLNARSAFNKWNMHKELRQYESIRNHLPKSLPFRESKDIKKMLGQSQLGIYMKPVIGSKGSKIIRIDKCRGDGYVYKYVKGSLVEERVHSFHELLIELGKIIANRKMMIQETIDMLTYDGNIVDFRAEIQRNWCGKLEVVSIFPRIGASNSPITNLDSGAVFMKFEDFFQNRLNYTDEQCEDMRFIMDKFVKKMHVAMEKIYGPLGETAIDFALDRGHYLWFIECNATSTKLAFLKADVQESIVERAFTNPLEYAQYLCKQSDCVNVR